MDHFHVQKGELHAENIPLSQVAQDFGTPTYVYSRATITRHVRVLTEGIGQMPHLICYAVKANANLAILDLMKILGCGFDAVSIGELKRAQAIDAKMSTTILSGVGKRDDEITAALDAGVLYISAESAEELDAISLIASKRGKPAPVSCRINPDVDAKTHPYIATGMATNKFGIPYHQAPSLMRRCQDDPWIIPVGISCHIGSQITQLAPFVDAAKRMAALACSLASDGIALSHIGMGGGLGVPHEHHIDSNHHDANTPPLPKVYGRALAEVLAPLNLTLVLEPGRVIVGNAGILLTRVIRKKQGSKQDFLILDAGMNDFLRPALYKAAHHIEPVSKKSNGPPIDVVGPVCESADTFTHAAPLGHLLPGDLVAIRTAGAYASSMLSTYNGRPKPAEILIDGDKTMLVRSRQTYQDLWREEHRLSK